MSDYFKINNYSRNGNLFISRYIFESIAQNAVNKINGVSVSKTKNKLFLLSNPVNVTFRKDGLVELQVSIDLKKETNVNEICKKIQEEIASSLMLYLESVPFKVQIKVNNIV